MDKIAGEKIIKNVLASFQIDSIIVSERIIEEAKKRLIEKPNILIKEKGN